MLEKICFTVLGFYDKWTNWIIECITTTTLSMTVNESLGIRFNLKKVFSRVT